MYCYAMTSRMKESLAMVFDGRGRLVHVRSDEEIIGILNTFGLNRKVTSFVVRD